VQANKNMFIGIPQC